MPRSPTVFLLCVAALAAAACADNPQAPRAASACDAVRAAGATRASSTISAKLSRQELGPVLDDAAGRVAPALDAGASGAGLQQAMTSLATSWPNQSAAACSALLDALSAVRQLPDDDATVADRAALQLALDQAVALMAAAPTH